ncbi:MAG: Mur ligase domain-containing protein, partial [Clostridiales bacterium]|nr:Mur ligase domain-containing protein [Clostridiales bacterium]
MLLSKMCEGLEYRLAGEDLDIETLHYDSRKVVPGCMFCCIVGTFSDGHVYAIQAVEKGAFCLLVEQQLPLKVPQVVVKNTRKAMAHM